MTEVDTPLEIVLDEGQIEALRNGEVEELVLEENDEKKAALEITWQEEHYMEGTKQFHDEISRILE